MKTEYLSHRVGGFIAAFIHHKETDEHDEYRVLWLLVPMDFGPAEWHEATCAASRDVDNCWCEKEGFPDA